MHIKAITGAAAHAHSTRPGISEKGPVQRHEHEQIAADHPEHETRPGDLDLRGIIQRSRAALATGLESLQPATPHPTARSYSLSYSNHGSFRSAGIRFPSVVWPASRVKYRRLQVRVGSSWSGSRGGEVGESGTCPAYSPDPMYGPSVGGGSGGRCPGGRSAQ